MSIFKWTTPPKKIYYRIDMDIWPVNETFTYTWSDQTWTVPYTQEYIITCKWAGSNTSKWWLAQGTLTLNAGDVLSIMVGQRWASSWSRSYWFWGLSNRVWQCSGGWLSWVFTGSWTITASDSARALVIWWWAGFGEPWWCVWWAWWGETWWNWTRSGGWTYWWWGTQNWRWSSWYAGANQFNGWDWNSTFWFWWWWGWYGWNWWFWTILRNSGWGWWGSGYVISTASNRVLTQWWWADANSNWEVTIVSVYQW